MDMRTATPQEVADSYENEIQGICTELALLVRALLAQDSGINWSEVAAEAKGRVLDLQQYLVDGGRLEIQPTAVSP